MLQLLAGTDVVKGLVRFERHRPEQTLLYKLVEQYYPDFEMQWVSEGRVLPDYVRQEFDEYLKCGRLEHRFLRVQCETCHAEHLVAFSCKRRGLFPGCGTRRMAESAALLVDEVLPHNPIRQWVLSFPYPLSFLFASCPAVSEKRLSLTPNGNVRYQLKTPYRDGTTHVIFEPLDFIARLAALVPRPRVNLTRFHGVFAPNSARRALVTPAKRGKRGKGNKRHSDRDREEKTPAERRASMTLAQRLKRVFNIDIETCAACGGAVKVIACIEDPVVIQKILTHLKGKALPEPLSLLPSVRAPPAGLLG